MLWQGQKVKSTKMRSLSQILLHFCDFHLFARADSIALESIHTCRIKKVTLPILIINTFLANKGNIQVRMVMAQPNVVNQILF